MKVLIVGCGKVGSVLGRILSRDKEIYRVNCADIVTKKIPSEITNFHQVDASNKHQLLKLLRKLEPDFLVNLSHPMNNEKIIQDCLEEKINYLDTASFWDWDQRKDVKSPYRIEQLDYDSAFRNRGLIGLINAGVSPGLTNLLAARCANELDRVKNIYIRLMEESSGSDSIFSWSPEWLLDEIEWKPLVYRKNQFRIMENFSEEEDWNFPSPIGKKKVCLISQEEIGTIPLYLKTKNVDIKAYDSNSEIFSFLYQSGLTSEKNIRVEKSLVNPQLFFGKLISSLSERKENYHEKSFFAVDVSAQGYINGRIKNNRYFTAFPKQSTIERLYPGANFISYPTALMVYLFLKAARKSKKRGVLPPECLEKEEMEFIFQRLESDFNIKIKKVARIKN